MNPLYQSFNQNNNILQRFNEFKRTYKGDARQQVQQMLNSGRISQEQYNRAVQQANMLKNMLGH